MKNLKGKISDQLFELIQKKSGIATPLMSGAVKRCTAVRIGHTTFVLGYEQVCEVMRRESDFGLAQLNRDRVVTGDFLLTRDNTPEFREERSAVMKAIGNDVDGNNEMIDAIRSHARTRSDEILSDVAPDRLFDVAKDLAEPIAAETIQKFVIGSDEDDAASRPELITDLTNLGRLLVGGGSGNKTLLKAAQVSGGKLTKRLERKYGHCHSKQNSARDCSLMSRMVAAHKLVSIEQVDAGKQPIIANVAGACLAGCLTVSSSVARALDQLLTRPDVLVAATAAAERGIREHVLRYVLEVLRFNPMFPVLRRYSFRQASLETGDGGKINIDAGDTVLLAMQAAMLDPRVLATPERIRLDRPMREYLFFGHGPHECVGHQLAKVQLEEIFVALLKKRPRPYSVTPRLQSGIQYRSTELGNTWPAARRFQVWLDGQG